MKGSSGSLPFGYVLRPALSSAASSALTSAARQASAPVSKAASAPAALLLWR